MKIKPWGRSAIALVALYFIAYFPLPFLRGEYWDGWVWLHEFQYQDFAVQNEFYHAIFIPQSYWMMHFVNLFPNQVIAARVVIFLAWLAAGLMLFHILRRQIKLSETSSFWITAYYLLFPAFFVRFEISSVYYTLANTLFVGGAALALGAVAHPRTRKIVQELLALPLFLLSFFLNSFISLYLVFLGALFFLHARQTDPHVSWKRAIGSWIKRYWYWAALPIVCAIARVLIFVPKGTGNNYNTITLLKHPSLSTLGALIGDTFGALYNSLLWPFASSLRLFEYKFFIAAFAVSAVLTFIAIRWHNARPAEEADAPTVPSWAARLTRSPAAALFLIGFIAVMLGLLPYVLAGKPPHAYGYGFGLRHTLCVPLGAALMLFGAITFFVRESRQRIVHLALLALFSAFFWYNSYQLDMDWYKQEAILASLPSAIKQVPAHATLVFNDESVGYNWLSRTVGSPEYHFYLGRIAGPDVYQGASRGDFDTVPTPEALAHPAFEFRVISEDSKGPTVKKWARLKWMEWTQSDAQFREQARTNLGMKLILVGPTTSAVKH